MSKERGAGDEAERLKERLDAVGYLHECRPDGGDSRSFNFERDGFGWIAEKGHGAFGVKLDIDEANPVGRNAACGPLKPELRPCER